MPAHVDIYVYGDREIVAYERCGENSVVGCHFTSPQGHQTYRSKAKCDCESSCKQSMLEYNEENDTRFPRVVCVAMVVEKRGKHLFELLRSYTHHKDICDCREPDNACT